MSCPGLHCAGCAGGAAVPVVPLLAIYGAAWVAEHIVEVAIVAGTCGALALAAVVALLRWCNRRDARQAAMWRFQRAREVPSTRAVPLSPAPRAAIAPAAVHLHFHGLPDAEQAEVIRRAIGGTIES